ncbi:hypothetical protein [Embleya scabrispora]|uniref:hypothetical protein n=1 Tax=Embleya scabrispora TaxID=159449 RepID=UPI0003709C1D|nr:hypothetical protein [Embleya scabrispora]MYS82428.1 hypothetical protein [Streptomyces sp. SID5474]
MPETETPHVDIDDVTETAGVGRIPEQRAGTSSPFEGARSAVDGLPGDLGALPYEPDAPRTQTRLVAAVGANPGGREPRAAHGITRARRWIRLRRS